MSNHPSFNLFSLTPKPSEPSVNRCNHYLFDRIDDIIDRVPNSQLEHHYGSLTPPDVAVPSDFWRTVIGPDYQRDIQVIAQHNNSDTTTTIKTLNFFGSMFLETQEMAQAILAPDPATDKTALRQGLTTRNRFISWVASQLCMDIAVISGDAGIDPRYRLDVFNDCGQSASSEDFARLNMDYQARFDDYSKAYPTGAFDQYKNDLRDVYKDLGIYLSLYPEHVTTNTVLSHYLCNNPQAELISLNMDDTDINRVNHPLNKSFNAVCHQTGINPDNVALAVFDRQKELPEFSSLGESPKWQAIKQATPIASDIVSALIMRREGPTPSSGPGLIL